MFRAGHPGWLRCSSLEYVEYSRSSRLASRAPRSGTSAKQSVGEDTLIVPDVNLLLYAYDADSRFHAAAAAWWRACLSGREPVGLPPVVVFGFVRIGTSARVFEQPMTPGEAAGHVRAWLAQPVVQVLEPRADHIERVLSLLESLGTAGNLVTDAQIAALVLESDAVLHTTDTDFLRFTALRWLNPLTGITSRKAPTRPDPSQG